MENKEQTLADIETKSKRIIKMIERAYRDNAACNLSDELLDEMMQRFGKERQALEEQRQKLGLYGHLGRPEHPQCLDG